MQRILIVDDDKAMRGLLRLRLSDTYEIIETGNPEEALGLSLEHKPDAILLDLMMPKFTGFELVQSLHNLSYTAQIPLFVITGESAEAYNEHCANLGARCVFQKPIDFKNLKTRLASELEAKRPERRAHVRVQMKVPLKLRGVDAGGASFEESTVTENVSAGGFLCTATKQLVKDAVVEVFLVSSGETLVGRAKAVRREGAAAPWPRYGFQFVDKPENWVLRG
jgi:response regulator RpfG family c-di-GMP phosphodiesterase